MGVCVALMTIFYFAKLFLVILSLMATLSCARGRLYLNKPFVAICNLIKHLQRYSENGKKKKREEERGEGKWKISKNQLSILDVLTP